jgi:O-antigen/teichoic acid export membrane protein
VLQALAKRARFARILGGSILSQILLSATNFAVGIILVRGAPQVQYGYYVLINSAVPLLAQLQGAFITPNLQVRVTIAGVEERRAFVGGLLREQRLLLMVIGLISLVVCALAGGVGALGHEALLIAVLGSIATVATLFRECRRVLLIAYRQSLDVLRGDAVSSAILIAGVWLSTLTDAAAAISAAAIAVAATVGGTTLSRALRRHDPWASPGTPHALIQTIKMGTWAAVGAGVHWAFTQGYTFIVASRLDVSAVAAIAATRLLLSPVGVFSIGISSMMYSTSTLWLKHHGPRGLLRRVLLFTLAMSVVAVSYIAVMWLLRDWIFLHVFKKDYPQRDLLLGIWTLVFLCTVVRDQVIFLLIAQARWRQLAGLTSVCAFLGLSMSFLAIPAYGAAGGLLGLLMGESAHVVGVILLTYRDMRTNGGNAAPGPTAVSEEVPDA